MKDTTLNRHVTEFWLTAMYTLAAQTHSLKADGSVIPRELERLREKAIRNYANASIGCTFVSFEAAVDFASETSAKNKRGTAVCRLTVYDSTGDCHNEIVVYPTNAIPDTPPYARLETLTTFHGATA